MVTESAKCRSEMLKAIPECSRNEHLDSPSTGNRPHGIDIASGIISDLEDDLEYMGGCELHAKTVSFYRRDLDSSPCRYQGMTLFHIKVQP